MAVLIILTGKHQGKRLSLPEGEVVIGREPTCHIRLSTEEVSREHCRIRCQSGSVFVTDLKSRNGTMINGVAIHGEAQLQPGDNLRIGPIAFELAGKKAAAVGAAVTAGVNSTKPPTDESIVDWISEGADAVSPDSADESNADDTTIVQRDPAPRLVGSPKSIAAAEISPATPAPGQKKKSIGEEGEDIIQRHFELIQSGKLPKNIPALKSR